MLFSEAIAQVEGILKIERIGEFSDRSSLIQATFTGSYNYQVDGSGREVNGNGTFTLTRNLRGEVEPESAHFQSYSDPQTSNVEWRWDGRSFQIVDEAVVGST